MVRKHQISAEESYRDGLTKKSSTPACTKIGAYETSQLKCDNEDDSR